MAFVLNSASFEEGLLKSFKNFELSYTVRVRRIVHEAHKRLMDKTPVNTGQTVANYIATRGRPYSGPALSGWDPVEATNSLPVGAERLRPQAEATARASLSSLNFDDPYHRWWITNKAPQVSGLEYGELPHAPYRPRAPRGMFRVTLQELAVMLDSGKFGRIKL